MPVASNAPLRRLDLHDLPPPEPLLRIEEALSSLPPGASLEAHTPRPPLPLLERLKAAGWNFSLQRLDDGSAIVLITRPN